MDIKKFNPFIAADKKDVGKAAEIQSPTKTGDDAKVGGNQNLAQPADKVGEARKIEDSQVQLGENGYFNDKLDKLPKFDEN